MKINRSIWGAGIVTSMLVLCGCTTTGEVYTGAAGEELDMGRTIGLVVGAAVLYEATKHGGGGSNPSLPITSCTGPYCNQLAAWDHLPGNGQWRCRDTGGHNGGQFVNDSACSGQYQVDNWE